MKKFVLFTACTLLLTMLLVRQKQRAQANSPAATSVNMQLPQDFFPFYEKFHSDPSYQLKHITFPLQGVPPMTDRNQFGDLYRWEKDDWVIHQKPGTFDIEIQTEYFVLGDGLVVEYILVGNSTFGMERRFAKHGNDWNLIYYSAINDLSKQN